MQSSRVFLLKLLSSRVFLKQRNAITDLLMSLSRAVLHLATIADAKCHCLPIVACSGLLSLSAMKYLPLGANRVIIWRLTADATYQGANSSHNSVPCCSAVYFQTQLPLTLDSLPPRRRPQRSSSMRAAATTFATHSHNRMSLCQDNGTASSPAAGTRKQQEDQHLVRGR